MGARAAEGADAMTLEDKVRQALRNAALNGYGVTAEATDEAVTVDLMTYDSDLENAPYAHVYWAVMIVRGMDNGPGRLDAGFRPTGGFKPGSKCLRPGVCIHARTCTPLRGQ